jgi:hypothetical protein
VECRLWWWQPNVNPASGISRLLTLWCPLVLPLCADTRSFGVCKLDVVS